MKKITNLLVLLLLILSANAQSPQSIIKMPKDTSRFNMIMPVNSLVRWTDTTIAGYKNLYSTMRIAQANESIRTLLNENKVKIVGSKDSITEYVTPKMLTDSSALFIRSDNSIFSWNYGSNSTAIQSNFIGYQAGFLTTNSNHSNFIGVSAGYQASSAYDANFLGVGAGYQATSSYISNFFGPNSGREATSAYESNFFGNGAGYQATNSSNSNFFGKNAGRVATSSGNSNFIGYQAGYGASSSGGSNFIGYSAGYGAKSVMASNFIGYSAGENDTSASYCNIFGYKAGKWFSGNKIGSNNIIIGSYISLPNGANNSMNLGGVLFATGLYSVFSGNPSITPTSSGKVGIGVVAPSERFEVNGNIKCDTIKANVVSGITQVDTSGLYHLNRSALDLVLGANTGDTVGHGLLNSLISLKLNATDTGDMLLPYLKKANSITESSTNTFSNKRITKRIYQNIMSNLIVPDKSQYDEYVITAQNQGIEIRNSGTSQNEGDEIVINLFFTAGSYTITWGTMYKEYSGFSLPITGYNKRYIMKFRWDSVFNIWNFINLTIQDAPLAYVSQLPDTTSLYHSNRTALNLVSGTNTGDTAGHGVLNGLINTKIAAVNKDSTLTGDGNGTVLHVVNQFWTPIEGSPTKTTKTTFTCTGDYSYYIAKGLIVKWKESSTVRCGMVDRPASWDGTYTTVTIVGDTIVAAGFDANSVYYCKQSYTKIDYAIAGTIGATATDCSRAYYANEPMRILGCDMQVGTVASTSGTTNVNLVNGTGTVTIVSPSLAYNVATTTTTKTANPNLSLALNDRLQLNIIAVTTTTFPVDLYVQLFLFPTRLLYLK
ncbi:MAG: hypothetical protein NTZ33_13800 [Bacteroidetes bacterium]|nr:hypothetical protein [Bacteroidota bacterium]